MPTQTGKSSSKPKPSQAAKNIKPTKNTKHTTSGTGKKKKRKKKKGVKPLTILWLVIVVALATVIGILHLNSRSGGTGDVNETVAPEVTAAAATQPAQGQDTPGEIAPTPVPTPTPYVTPTPAPTPTPMPIGHDEINPENVNDAQKPSSYSVETKVYANGTETSSYQRAVPININPGMSYASLEGVTTFRGNNYRDTGSYGQIPDNATQLHLKYNFKIGGIDSWTGVGWTGQPAIVRWNAQTRRNMNIRDDKKAKDGLVEVIYAALDGKIYFFDLEDGEFTRDPIKVPGPIKGSVTIDPRGYPLLYVGQGIEEVDGNTVKIGLRIFSLIDQSELLFINGRDQFATRHWYASDCAPIIDANSDTCIWAGENGLLYTITLNSQYDTQAGHGEHQPGHRPVLFVRDDASRHGEFRRRIQPLRLLHGQLRPADLPRPEHDAARMDLLYWRRFRLLHRGRAEQRGRVPLHGDGA